MYIAAVLFDALQLSDMSRWTRPSSASAGQVRLLFEGNAWQQGTLTRRVAEDVVANVVLAVW